jgi:hypothetical protein
MSELEMYKKAFNESDALNLQWSRKFDIDRCARIRLEQENKMMLECIEFVIANSGTSTNYNLKCREALSKLTKDER